MDVKDKLLKLKKEREELDKLIKESEEDLRLYIREKLKGGITKKQIKMSLSFQTFKTIIPLAIYALIVFFLFQQLAFTTIGILVYLVFGALIINRLISLAAMSQTSKIINDELKADEVN